MIDWIASYPKSGNTWVLFLVHNALYEPADDLSVFLERIPYVLRVARTWRPTPGRVDLLKSHLKMNDAHPMRAFTSKGVYVVRDPRDVLLSNLSYRVHREGGGESDTAVRAMTDEQYARAFIENGGDPEWAPGPVGAWADNVESWTGETSFPVLTVRYEDLEQDAAAQLARVLDFLERPVADALIERAVETSAFGVLREAEVRRRREAGYSTDALFFNEGRSGRSLDQAIAPGLDAAFDAAFADALARHGYATRSSA